MAQLCSYPTKHRSLCTQGQSGNTSKVPGTAWLRIRGTEQRSAKHTDTRHNGTAKEKQPVTIRIPSRQ